MPEIVNTGITEVKNGNEKGGETMKLKKILNEEIRESLYTLKDKLRRQERQTNRPSETSYQQQYREYMDSRWDNRCLENVR